MLKIPRPTKRPPTPPIYEPPVMPKTAPAKKTYMVYIRRVMFQTNQDIVIVKANDFVINDDVIIFTSGLQRVALFNKCDVEKILVQEPTQTE